MSNSKDVSSCKLCGNYYLAIRTDIYKDKRAFVYCDCCGAMADSKSWYMAHCNIEEPDDVGTDSHPDDIAVDKFTAAMKTKMAKQRAKGYSGWDDKEDCPTERLQQMLVDHVAKGDPVDVGNFAMMLFNRGEVAAAPKVHCSIEEPDAVKYITPLMEDQMFNDWCPYKGNPDPRTVWAAAIQAVNGLLLGADKQEV